LIQVMKSNGTGKTLSTFMKVVMVLPFKTSLVITHISNYQIQRRKIITLKGIFKGIFKEKKIKSEILEISAIPRSGQLPQEPRSFIWIYTNGKSAKVWGYDSFSPTDNAPVGTPYSVICFWGPLGKHIGEMQQKRFEFEKHWEAYDFIRLKTDEKERKGYKKIPRILFQRALDVFRKELYQLMYPEEFEYDPNRH